MGIWMSGNMLTQPVPLVSGSFLCHIDLKTQPQNLKHPTFLKIYETSSLLTYLKYDRNKHITPWICKGLCIGCGLGLQECLFKVQRRCVKEFKFLSMFLREIKVLWEKWIFKIFLKVGNLRYFSKGSKFKISRAVGFEDPAAFFFFYWCRFEAGLFSSSPPLISSSIMRLFFQTLVLHLRLAFLTASSHAFTNNLRLQNALQEVSFFETLFLRGITRLLYLIGFYQTQIS